MTAAIRQMTVERRHTCYAVCDEIGDVTHIDLEPRFYNGAPCGSITSRGRTAEELEAIAKLFAAAPKMLAALKHARQLLEDMAGGWPGTFAIDARQLSEVVDSAIFDADG